NWIFIVVSLMQKTKTIYVVESCSTRYQQLATVLNFLGEEVKSLAESEIASLCEQELPQCVVVGDCNEALSEVATRHPAVPFISAHKNHKEALQRPNVIGELGE